jgi:hypothetical protein
MTNPLRRLVEWLRAKPDGTAAAVRYEQETNKTAAFDAPPAARGFTWRP